MHYLAFESLPPGHTQVVVHPVLSRGLRNSTKPGGVAAAFLDGAVHHFPRTPPTHNGKIPTGAQAEGMSEVVIGRGGGWLCGR